MGPGAKRGEDWDESDSLGSALDCGRGRLSMGGC